ncbi:MAG: hypothetical protein WCL29_01560 [Pseudomonadota bacterium]
MILCHRCEPKYLVVPLDQRLGRHLVLHRGLVRAGLAVVLLEPRYGFHGLARQRELVVGH